MVNESHIRVVFASVLLGLGFFAGHESEAQENANRNPVTTAVDPLSYNAFLLWRDGAGVPILDYPEDFPSRAMLNKSDGEVFYGLRKDAPYNPQSRTAGVKILEGDVLVYPERGGRQLKLKFYPISGPKEPKFDTLLESAAECKIRPPFLYYLFSFLMIIPLPCRSADGHLYG